jgi:hypothetical protein
MFILYALLVGLLVGLVSGGRLDGIAALQFRWPLAMLGGLLVQLILFSDRVTVWIGSAGPPIYVLSTALVVAAVLANHPIKGMPIVALGAVSNLAAIIANGGFMPADPGALQVLGREPSGVYSNSAVVPNPVLAPLTDLFALPTWVPFTNVFSIGDVLIGAGVAVVIVAAMRRRLASSGVAGRPVGV